MNASDCTISEKLAMVRKHMTNAALRAGRKPDDVRLIAVAKYVPHASIEAAILSGQRCFADNTLQGAMSKQTLLQDPLNEWHFIGHLQSNKAKSIPGHFNWLHTLDSLKLARRLSEGATCTGKTINTLLQVNIANDPSKYGLNPGLDSIYPFIDALLGADLPGIRLRGLMTIGRRDARQDETRQAFSALRNLAENCANHFGKSYFSELSMGMSNDYELAIAEGATLVRIGSALFGPRT